MSKTACAIDFLKSKNWAAPLVQLIEDSGGIRNAPQGYLFEARFAFELGLACPEGMIQYEFKTGVGETSVDFRLDHDGSTWLIELVSLEETVVMQDLRAASREQLARGLWTESYVLSADAKNRYETPLAELLHVGERIEDKVWNKKRGEPAKFPEPRPNQGHLLLVNMSGFEGSGDPDGDHCREVVFGSSRTQTWVSDPCLPIVGLFDPANPRRGAREVSSRIHVIAFVAERPGCEDDDEIRRTAFFLANPRLNGRSILGTYPVVSCPEQRDPLYGKEAHN